MRIEGKEYRTIWFENNVVKIIDQTKLPHLFVIKNLKTIEDAINAIKKMEVRGAPLIGATAAYGLVLAIIENNDQSFLKKSAENLINSRPTAINLKWAVDRMMNKLSGVNSDKILELAKNEAKEICEEDIKFCHYLHLIIYLTFYQQPILNLLLLVLNLLIHLQIFSKMIDHYFQ